MMELIYTLQLLADAESTYKGIMVHIIQLVILCIPLLLIPTILKTSSSVMGKIAGASDRFHREFSGRAAKGIAKNTPGLRGGFEMAQDWKRGREERYNRGVSQRRNARLTGQGRFGKVGQRIGLRAAGGFRPEGQARALAAGEAGYQKEQSEAAQNAEFLLGGSRAAAEAAISGNGDHLTGSDRIAYDKFTTAGGVKNLAGARAAASVLGKTGGLNARAITQLSQSGVHNGREGSEFAEHINSVAREANMDYLAENTAGADGQIILGGQRPENTVLESLNTEIKGKGFGNMARQAYEDNTPLTDSVTGTTTTAQEILGRALVGSLQNPSTTASARRQVAQMDDRKLESAARAMHIANTGMFASEDAAIERMRQIRTQGRSENPGIQ